MPDLTEIVIDRKVLDSFKRRALKLYPREFMEQLVGKIAGNQVHLYAFRDLEHKATRYEVVIDEDLEPMTEGDDERRYQILGTIHTHPQATIEPSDLDWETMARDDELIMGICAIRKTSKRRFVSFAFYSGGRTQLQLTVSEAVAAAMSAKA